MLPLQLYISLLTAIDSRRMVARGNYVEEAQLKLWLAWFIWSPTTAFNFPTPLSQKCEKALLGDQIRLDHKKVDFRIELVTLQ